MNFKRAIAIGARATGALAVGAAAVGALAVGRLAIGRLAIGRLTLGRVRVGDLHVERLVVGSVAPSDQTGIALDHMIFSVGERARSLAFYTSILGLQHDGEDGPFAVLRVSPHFVLLLAESEAAGGQHVAFALSKAGFDAAFERLRTAGVPFGDRFDTVGNLQGPADESGARGVGKALYFFDPDRHLIEIRHYEN
jgi:catechol 2,3-dioxygenase-like lactoylglutathione lyase family enzyme